MRPALLVLDPQNDFFKSDTPNLEQFQRVATNINLAIRRFRQESWPFIFILHTSSHKPEGSFAWGVYKEFDCRTEDAWLSKSHHNAFWETDLHTFLLSEQVTFVLVAGYLSEYCVLSTYRGALERGYAVAILADGIASTTPANTKFVLEITEVATLEQVCARND
jgi:nicotinamidase-related amidase